MFDYQKTSRYFCQIAGGLEEYGAGELAALGSEEIKPAFRGIYFAADKETLYRINYCSRFIMRVLAPLLSFPCHNDRTLYKRAKDVPWTSLIRDQSTFAISSNVVHSRMRHSQFAALRLKDAIVDRFSDDGMPRPNVDRKKPDVRINLHIDKNRAVISLDASGQSLHRRGYRRESVEAPMQETLAALILHLSEWDGSKTLYDPMCGSGTLLAESLMHYCRIPSGYLRDRFGFEFLPDFDRELWKEVRDKADQMIRPAPDGLIAGSDPSAQAVEAARRNLSSLPNGKAIVLKIQAFDKIQELGERTIVCNPPYGIRMGTAGDLGDFYKAFGDFLKQRCKGSTAYIYFGNREMISKIGLKTSWKKPLSSAGLDGRLVKLEIY